MDGRSQRVTVFIASDQPAFAQGLAHLLADHASLTVIGTAIVDEAPVVLRECFPDLVLLDTTGHELDIVATITAAAAESKVVVLAAIPSVDDLCHALRAGALAYTTKDREATEIADLIRATARGNYVIPAHLTHKLVSCLGANRQPDLNPDELDLLTGIENGDGNGRLARRLNVSERTLRRRLERLYGKIGVTDRVDATLYARSNCLTPTE